MDEKQQQQQPGQMQIKADEKELQGLYSNLMMIHHNVEEFTLNFVYIFPNGTQGKLLRKSFPLRGPVWPHQGSSRRRRPGSHRRLRAVAATRSTANGSCVPRWQRSDFSC
jgi:hypothetical protein